MKRLILLVVLMNLLFSSCDKKATADSVPETLEGNWRMVAVTDNNTGDVSTKPDSIQGNVDLSFTLLTDSSGTYTGHTPTNEITTNPFSTGVNHQLRVLSVGMSYATETSWGYEFVDNICESRQYTFESENKLVIITTSKTLAFQRQ